ncbi:MAG: hypothetical protein LUF00_01100 [Lachnospiraceae bacterium]|nr:hypothetical protein [Lachnospiraceae bacterium]
MDEVLLIASVAIVPVFFRLLLGKEAFEERMKEGVNFVSLIFLTMMCVYFWYCVVYMHLHY